MIQSAQQRAAIEQQAQAGISAGNIATVASVSTDGLTLILPGESTAGSKKYPYNHSYTFSAGRRVHIAREGGTIIADSDEFSRRNLAKVGYEANPLEDEPPYLAMLRDGLCRVTGFEPQQEALKRLR